MSAHFKEDVLVPHFDLPFRFSGGTAVVVEQDSLDDIANCVEAIIRYPVGSRPEALDFGIEDPTFSEGGTDLDALRDAVEESEDRAGVLLDYVEDELEQARSLEDGLELIRVTVEALG